MRVVVFIVRRKLEKRKMNCKYYCDRFLGWVLNNKIIVFLSLLCFCLFVSTLAIAGQRNRLSNELSDLTSTTTTTTTTTPQPETGGNNTDTDEGTDNNNPGDNNAGGNDTDSNIVDTETNEENNDTQNDESKTDGNNSTGNGDSSAGGDNPNPNSQEAVPNAGNVEASKPEEQALLDPSTNIGLDSNLLQILAGGA